LIEYKEYINEINLLYLTITQKARFCKHNLTIFIPEIGCYVLSGTAAGFGDQPAICLSRLYFLLKEKWHALKNAYTSN